ncbi:type VI secretion protein [Pseudomonas aeruginosa]|nr:type VI secretion protein [Pseudomonas aeruginosa]
MSTSAAQQGRKPERRIQHSRQHHRRDPPEPDDEAYDIAKRGVSAFIEELLKPQNDGEPVKKAMVDRMIAEIDAKLSTQMDEILHHPDFQALESAWRGLQLLVDRTNFRENIKIEILSVSKQDLLDDFEDSPEVMQSGLYKHIYTAEYGQFGGQPVGAIIANYYMSPSSPDVKLMQYVSSVACMAHAPFVAAAGPKFFGLESFTGLPDLKGPEGSFRRPAVRQVAELPPVRGFPLRGADRTALPAAHALRSGRESGQVVRLQGDRGQQPRALPVGQHRLCLRPPS